jgi:hypothetical protein
LALLERAGLLLRLVLVAAVESLNKRRGLVINFLVLLSGIFLLLLLRLCLLRLFDDCLGLLLLLLLLQGRLLGSGLLLGRSGLLGRSDLLLGRGGGLLAGDSILGRLLLLDDNRGSVLDGWIDISVSEWKVC